MDSSVLEPLGGAGLVVTTLALAWAYTRQSTVSAAMQTIEILKTRVESFESTCKELKAENAELRSKVLVLTETVSGAKAVRELADWARSMAEEGARRREAEHNENLVALSRLEGGISRMEEYLLHDRRK